MKRREFITLVGGATVLPVAARAQQPDMPVIGFLNSQSPDTYSDRLRAFHRGLKETDYVESENVTVLYRCGDRCGKHSFGVGGQGRNHDHPHRLHHRR